MRADLNIEKAMTAQPAKKRLRNTFRVPLQEMPFPGIYVAAGILALQILLPLASVLCLQQFFS
jgi:hypothetical protein